MKGATVAVIHRDAELTHLRCLVCGEQWARERFAESPPICPAEAKHASRRQSRGQVQIPKRPTLPRGPE